jgi:hypothetical protein
MLHTPLILTLLLLQQNHAITATVSSSSGTKTGAAAGTVARATGLTVDFINSLYDDNSQNEKFYIYPLAEKYWWAWPEATSNCSRHNQLSHLHAQNMGES